NDGEILTRGANVMRGYWGSSHVPLDVVDAGGWLHTGDLGRCDEDGFVYVTGRKKDLIVLGDGQKVQPEEVASALASGTLFRELCVLGVSARDGLLAGTEEVCAVVVPNDRFRAQAGHESHAFEALAQRETDRLCAKLAAWKRPARVLVRQEELPRTATL